MRSFPGGPAKSGDAGGSSSSVSWVTPLPVAAVIAVTAIRASFHLGGSVGVEISALGPRPKEEPTGEDDRGTLTAGAEIHLV